MKYQKLYPWQLIGRDLPMSYKLPMTYDVMLLRRDFNEIAKHFMPKEQYDVYHSGGWNAICLNAIEGRVDADFSGAGPYLKTPALLCAPYIEQILDSFKCEKLRVRLLGLPPGESIYWHMDAHECIESGVARIHIPIFTNSQVEMQINHEDLHWECGEVWYGDFSFPHRLRNRGSAVRTHLVIDMVVNEFVLSLFQKKFIIEPSRDLAKRKCRKYYSYYNYIFLMKTYYRLVKNNPRKIVPWLKRVIKSVLTPVS